MKVVTYKVLACSLLTTGVALYGQTSSSPVADQSTTQLQQKIEAISSALTATQHQLEQSQRQMNELQDQLIQLRHQLAATTPSTTESEHAVTSQPSSSSSSVNDSSTTSSLDERLQTLEAAVKLHDQTKVESASKYPVRLTGLILFNGFINNGTTDNTDLPAFAVRPTSTSGTGSSGAGFRQTILGVAGDGPHIAGAHTSANVNIDFFSQVSYTSYGTSAGVVRMRTASIDFDWANDSLQVGQVAPLISPLSPTSYATVAEPSLAGAGNLWAWSPQLRYAHRFQLHDGNHLQLEFGLWDPPAAGYNPNQFFRIPSPGEQSKQPAYETRISYGSTAERGLQLGVGSYYSRQSYSGYQGYIGTENLDSWAGTADWRLPFAHHFEISGEGYRGRALGGLGGGVYKDVVTGTDPVSAVSVLHGLNAIGGWTQFKTRFTNSLESNFSIGQDNGFARDFHAVVLPPAATATQLRARNKMVVANLIFRPKTYIIFSPEYRRIWTWPISGAGSTVDVFTLSAGYQF